LHPRVIFQKISRFSVLTYVYEQKNENILFILIQRIIFFAIFAHEYK